MDFENLDKSKIFTMVKLCKAPGGQYKYENVMVCTKWLRQLAPGYVICYLPDSKYKDCLMDLDEVDDKAWKCIRVASITKQSYFVTENSEQQPTILAPAIDITEGDATMSVNSRSPSEPEYQQLPQKKARTSEPTSRQVEKRNITATFALDTSSERATTSALPSSGLSASFPYKDNSSDASHHSMPLTSNSESPRSCQQIRCPSNCSTSNRKRFYEMMLYFISADETKLEEAIKPILLYAIKVERKRSVRLTERLQLLKAKIKALQSKSTENSDNDFPELPLKSEGELRQFEADLLRLPQKRTEFVMLMKKNLLISGHNSIWRCLSVVLDHRFAKERLTMSGNGAGKIAIQNKMFWKKIAAVVQWKHQYPLRKAIESGRKWKSGRGKYIQDEKRRLEKIRGSAAILPVVGNNDNSRAADQ